MAHEIMPERQNVREKFNLQVDAAVLELMSRVPDDGIHKKIEGIGEDASVLIDFKSEGKNLIPVGIREPAEICIDYRQPRVTNTHILLKGYAFVSTDSGWQVYERLVTGGQSKQELYKGYLGEHHIHELESAIQQTGRFCITEALPEAPQPHRRFSNILRQLIGVPVSVSIGAPNVPEESVVFLQSPVKPEARDILPAVDSEPSLDLCNTLLSLIHDSEMSYAQAVIFYGGSDETCEVYKNSEGAVVQVRCTFSPESGESADTQRIVELALLEDAFVCTESLIDLSAESQRRQQFPQTLLDFKTARDVLTVAYNSDCIDELTPER